MQFIPLVVLIAMVVLMLGDDIRYQGAMRTLPWWAQVARIQAYVHPLGLAIAAFCVLCFQYATRRTHLARIAGVAILILAGVVYWWLLPSRPVVLGFGIESHPRRYPDSKASFVVAGGQPARRFPLSPPGLSRIEVPLEPARLAVPNDARIVRTVPLETRISGPDGGWMSVPGGSWPAVMTSGLTTTSTGATLRLFLSSDFYDRVKGTAATVQGKMWLGFSELAVAKMPALSASSGISSSVRCASQVVGGPRDNEMLRVSCESPIEAPRASVTLFQPEGQDIWRHTLGDSRTFMGYPTRAWLSAMGRADTFFHLADPSITRYQASRWLAPRDAVDVGQLEIVLMSPTGYMLLTYEVKGVEVP